VPLYYLLTNKNYEDRNQWLEKLSWTAYRPEGLLLEVDKEGQERRGYGAILHRIQVSFAEYFHEIHRYTATFDLCNVSYREHVIKSEINALATKPTQLHFSPVQQYRAYLLIFGRFSSPRSVVP
jgi:hypothetical protein